MTSLPSPLASAIWPAFSPGAGRGAGQQLPTAPPDPPQLYQGGCDSYSLLINTPRLIDVLVLCASELQFDSKPGQSLWIGGPATEDSTVAYFERLPAATVLRCPMDDYKWPVGVHGQRVWRAIWKTAGLVAQAVLAGQRVLVTCAEGRNRSGLVNAVVLHQLTGWDGDTCIRHIQHRRARALDNPWFCARLQTIKATT